MQWLGEQIGAIGGGAGFIGFLVVLVGTIKARIEKSRAEIDRDALIAPRLLADRDQAQREKAEVTGRFEAQRRDLDGCREAKAACERMMDEMRRELDQERQRAIHERAVLHEAIGDLADHQDVLSGALGRGAIMADRMRKTFSRPEMAAYQSPPPLPPPPRVPRDVDPTAPEMPAIDPDRWEEEP